MARLVGRSCARQWVRGTGRITHAMVLMLFLAAATVVADDSDELAKLVQNVRSHEELYQQIDFAFDEHYEGVLEKPPSNATRVGLFQRRAVFQPGRYLFEEIRRGTSVDGKEFLTHLTEAYNGEVSRQIVRNPKSTVVNVHKGFVVQAAILRPHTVLLIKAFIDRMTLTEYLTAETTNNNRCRHRVFVMGDETINGLRCTHVRSERCIGQGGDTIRHLWLSHDHNYIPVKTVVFVPGYNAEIPLEVGEVREFQELSPGVWSPRTVHFDVYYETAAYEGRKVLSNRSEIKVTKAELNPHHNDAFFRDVEIPPGALIYEIDQGKITRDYQQPLLLQRGWSWLWWVLAAVVVGGAALGWRRYQRA